MARVVNAVVFSLKFGSVKIYILGGSYTKRNVLDICWERAGRELRYIQGERLVVAVENNLPQLSTVHWHDLRIPNAMDGVSGLTQAAVDPSGSYVYEFNLPDAGTFWYPQMSKVQNKLAGVYMGH